MANQLVYGVGVNDTHSPKQWIKHGKIVRCKAYTAWRNMLKKCYATKTSITVCDEWLLFSNFEKWFKENYKENCKLNNTLFGDGSFFSPDTTVYLDKMVCFFIRDTSYVGETKGIRKQPLSDKFHVRCNNPLKAEQEHVGYFTKIEDAKAAWLERKRKVGKKIAEFQNDARVKQAILNYF